MMWYIAGACRKYLVVTSHIENARSHPLDHGAFWGCWGLCCSLRHVSRVLSRPVELQMTERKACVVRCPTQVRRLREENDSLVASLQSQHSQGQEYTQELSALRETVKVGLVCADDGTLSCW
jgi:hypothetical protein